MLTLSLSLFGVLGGISRCEQHMFHNVKVVLRNRSDVHMFVSGDIDLFRFDGTMHTPQLFQQFIWSGPLCMSRRRLEPNEIVSLEYVCMALEKGIFGFSFKVAVSYLESSCTQGILITSTVTQKLQVGD